MRGSQRLTVCPAGACVARAAHGATSGSVRLKADAPGSWFGFALFPSAPGPRTRPAKRLETCPCHPDGTGGARGVFSDPCSVPTRRAKQAGRAEEADRSPPPRSRSRPTSRTHARQDAARASFFFPEKFLSTSHFREVERKFLSWVCSDAVTALQDGDHGLFVVSSLRPRSSAGLLSSRRALRFGWSSALASCGARLLRA